MKDKNDSKQLNQFHFFLRTKQKMVIADSELIEMAGIHIHIMFDVCLKNPLTFREMVCLALSAIGKNPEQCADLLNITYSSVITYEKRIRKKLGARNRINALCVAIQRGYLKIVR